MRPKRLALLLESLAGALRAAATGSDGTREAAE
jgi:hypothetical protein